MCNYLKAELIAPGSERYDALVKNLLSKRYSSTREYSFICTSCNKIKICSLRCSSSNFSVNNEEALKKLTKSKLKTDLKNLPPLIPKPMQDWFNSTVNGTAQNGTHFEGTNANNTSNGDVIEVDPWACSINQENHNEDNDLQPSQSKLRKLLSEHQVRYF